MAKNTAKDPLNITEENGGELKDGAEHFLNSPNNVLANAQQAFSPEQMAIINQLLENAKSTSARPGAQPMSVYGQRDPKSIDTVNVKRFDGKFVLGFKNQQNDPFKKHIPKYIRYAFDPIRKLDLQPYITLILADGTKDKSGNLILEEREVRHTDYMEPENRSRFDAKVLKLERREIVEDFGTLGAHALAGEIDNNWKPVHHPGIKQETKREEIVFWVELPGFEDPVEFINDPIGPLA